MSENPTILEIKQAFLTAQSRLLTQPLQPSRAWRRGNEAAGAGAREGQEGDRRGGGGGGGGGGGKLSDAAVDEALVHANNTLQQHSHRVYAPQATRHVAEQVDKLYYNAGERPVVGDKPDALGLVVDFGDDAAIATLPADWEDEREVDKLPAEAKKYSDLVSRLSDLSEQRKAVRERVQKLRRMNKLLEPFGGMNGEREDGEERKTPIHVQENLATRNGEVEKELERMRMLLARVGGRVSKIPNKRKRGNTGEDVEVEEQEQKKVQDLLTLI
ncbi:uncharacterized protein MKZ38_009667 [Zalerion maritima]|uniref:Kinetochore protein fta4 n=1 Tax=Zalerion maritima TaxID=339359 RepID=A0AAD5RUT3_9PEZI|nr:uncharacterized protein MKZ38_009667 [Zalerion maritima]